MKRIRILLTVLGLFFVTMSARTTTLARMSLDQLTAAADVVARVRCMGVESRWETGAIWTVTTFDVVETMKGTAPSRVTVQLPGGRVGHLTAAVDGTPKFKVGEETIVFLEKSRAGGFSIAGWVEGTFRIRHEPHTGIETVTQDSSAFAVFDTVKRSFRTDGVRQMPVEQFRERIATAVAHAREKTR